jgi:hypothetical protein
MSNAEFRIFLSAVSSEFRSARNELTDDFGARDVLVRVQEQFVPGRRPHTLLAALDEYISGCTTVICVIGRRSGACPTLEAATPFVHMLPNGVTQASYTQWEYFLARHYDKQCLLFLAQDAYKPDEATPLGADFPSLQRDFVERIKRSGLHYEGFATTDALCRAVGRHRWPERTATPSPATHKPIVLPYPSLGTLFKGRDDFLRRLRDSLARPNGAAAIPDARCMAWAGWARPGRRWNTPGHIAPTTPRYSWSMLRRVRNCTQDSPLWSARCGFRRRRSRTRQREWKQFSLG